MRLNLSNGEQVVVITVYVPANFVFVGGPISVMEVVHESPAKGGHGGPSPYTLSVTIKIGTDPIKRGHIETFYITVSDRSNPSIKIAGAKVSAELFYTTTFHKPISCSTTKQNGESQCSSIIGPNSIPGKFKITVDVSASRYKSTSKSATFTVIPANATIPINVTNTNTTSTNLTSATNMSGMIFKPLSNTSALIQPTNISVPATSGGKGSGSTCAAGNCTSGTTPPLVDCTKNPTDPSCTQTLTPSTTTPTTKTCPDGSVIDASATCPTQPASPPNPSNPSTQTPPSTGDNNPPPSSNDNGNNNPNNGANDNGKSDNNNNNGGGDHNSDTGSSKK